MKLCDEANKKGEGEMSKRETPECTNGQDFVKTVPAKWDKEADVVVVGYGGTGAVSAITISEKGGKVIVLEKAPEPGGNTYTSAGGMSVCDNAKKAAQYLKALSLGSIDEELAIIYGEAWVEMVPWLKQRGARLVFSEIPWGRCL
jgi:succinate dehydrogenase/fumarate reductase flavoprotein subunit